MSSHILAGMKRGQVVVRVWLLLALLMTTSRPSLAQKLPPQGELKALTDFVNANANRTSNGRNLGPTWNVGFNAQGNWSGGNPCHGYKGLRCWSTGNVRMLHLPRSGLSGLMSQALGNLTLITKLSLGENSLSGDITPALAQLVNMKRLRLQGNQLTGSVPTFLRNMVGLEELTLSRNVLQGRISAAMFANLTLLQIVDISNNSLSGTIPDDLVRIPSLQRLLLSGNNFTGAIPISVASSTSFSLNRVDLSRNHLNGPLPTLWVTPNLTSLDLSRNNLSGPIPAQLLNLTTLKSLNLAHNSFDGIVSVSLSTQFGCSAFTDNIGLIMEDPNCSTSVHGSPPPAPPPGDLTGQSRPVIPPLEANHHKKNRGLSTPVIVALTVGDIALLLLSAAGFAVFWIWWKKKDQESSKVGAGVGDSDDSKHSSTSPTKRYNKDDSMSSGRSTGSGSGEKSSFATTPALRPALKSIVGTIPDPDNDSEYMTAADASVDESLSYSIDDFGTDLVLLDSTLSLEFEDLLRANAIVLGAGSFGGVYMAVLEDGQMLAIKRLEEPALANEHAFGKQCTRLAEVLHPNLLQTRAYCWSPHEKLLIFDYMTNGSVHFNLHADTAPKSQQQCMDWPTRLKIAVGTARALAHLHDNDMVHGNIKATNVLLDEHFEPQVSDFGLEALLQTPLQHTASAGYLAPELGISTHHRTQVGDVYSFGVLLLELLTGLEPTGKNNMDLPTWVQEMTSTNRTVEVFDPALVSMHVLPAQDVLEFLELAQACVSEDARARPSITIVLRSLESIVPGSTAPRSLLQHPASPPA